MPDLTLGEVVDPATHRRTGTPVTVATADLTTHAVIVGMTGSGKTGLAIVLLEEALAAGVPAILIDPKGDLADLALVLPTLDAAAFAPWVDPAQAQAAGQTVEQFAGAQAAAWSEGLLSWGITADRLRRFRDAVDVAIFTPGSNAAIPVNLVGSLPAPAAGVELETVHDEIEGYVSGLLGHVGIEADPLSSREHILLSNLIETAWTAGRSLDLAGLVGQIPNPPVRKLGVFELDQFFPAADRMALALKLNGLLASTAFAAWSQGEPLDVGTLLRAPDGRPRCSIVSIAHLGDEERQFVVSLLLSKVVTWMRGQSGTTDLRALVYMDEVAGFVPPTAVPPSKRPILSLMKQARAFGVGMVLATQNPVDVDYKALSNAGTWMIGRLQTERDKARLLDGLTAAAGSVDVGAVGDTISALGKREFVLKRAASDAPVVFTSRWAMSYLRGPLTRDQLRSLSSSGAATPPLPAAPTTPVAATAGEAGSPAPVSPAPASAGPAPAAADESPVMPAVADGVPVRHVDPAAPWLTAFTPDPTASRLAAGALARFRLRFDDEKAGLVQDEEYELVLHPLDELVDVTAAVACDYDDRDLRTDAPAGARYVLPQAPVATKAWWTRLQRDLTDHVTRSRTIEVPRNTGLKLVGRPGETPEAFAERCRAAATERADAETATLRDKYEAKVRRLEQQLSAAEGRVDVLESERKGRLGQEVLGTAGSILGGFLGGRRNAGSILSSLGTAAGRRTRSAASAKRADAAQDRVEQLQAEHDRVEQELGDEVAAITERWDAVAAAVDTVAVALERTDVALAQLVLVWIPVPA